MAEPLIMLISSNRPLSRTPPKVTARDSISPSRRRSAELPPPVFLDGVNKTVAFAPAPRERRRLCVAAQKWHAWEVTQRDRDQHSKHFQILSDESLPSRNELNAGVRFVRPDRQFTYGDLARDQWPPPLLNDHSLVVDRIDGEIDVPPHRFLICIGDDVEIILDSTLVAKGCVVGVDHLTQEVCVAIRPLGLWWAPKETIFPAPSAGVVEDALNALDPARPLRQLATFEYDPLGLLAVRPVLTSFTFDEFPRLLAEMEKGEISYLDYRSEFERLAVSRDAIISELKERFKAPELARVAAAFGATHTTRATKDANAVSIYRAMLRTFVLDEAFSPSPRESLEDAVARAVRMTTSQQHFEHHWRKFAQLDRAD